MCAGVCGCVRVCAGVCGGVRGCAGVCGVYRAPDHDGEHQSDRLQCGGFADEERLENILTDNAEESGHEEGTGDLHITEVRIEGDEGHRQEDGDEHAWNIHH